MWQTDFSLFRIKGWGDYYLSTVLDDYSRYIIAWKLSPTMNHEDVEQTLNLAAAATGIKQIQVGYLVENPSTWTAETRARYEVASSRYYLRNREATDGT